MLKYFYTKINRGLHALKSQIYSPAFSATAIAPTFIYIDNGYYYTYNGPTEFEDLKRIIEEKTYLQYDRKIFITDLQPSYKMIAKYYYIEYTAAVIGGIFVVALALLHLPNICSKKSKEKKE